MFCLSLIPRTDTFLELHCALSLLRFPFSQEQAHQLKIAADFSSKLQLSSLMRRQSSAKGEHMLQQGQTASPQPSSPHYGDTLSIKRNS